MRTRFQLPLWRMKGGVVLPGVLVATAFYLLTEHAAHVFGALPYLLLPACPLVHLFMHHSNGGHERQQELDGRRDIGAGREHSERGVS